MLNDGHTALHTLTRIRHRFLISPLRRTQALESDFQPRLIHHREHAGETLIFFPNEITDRAAVVPVGHHTGGTTVDTELVLHRDGKRIVALAQRAICIHQKLGYKKQRDSSTALGGVGKPGQNQMNDVFGGIVVAPGDVDLLPEDAIVITLSLGTRFHGTQVGAGARLCQVHRSRPLSRVDLLQIGGLEVLTRMG